MRPFRPFLAALLVVALAGVVSVPAPAGAQDAVPPSDRERQLAERSLALSGQATEVRAAVLRVQAEVARQTERVATAEAAVEAAEANRSEAAARRAAARAEHAAQRAAVKRLAAASYIQGPANVEAVLRAQDINDVMRRTTIAAAAGDAQARLLTRLGRAAEEAESAEQAAEDAAATARSAVAAARDEAAALTAEQARQRNLLDAVDERLERTLAEAAAVAAVDAAVPEALAAGDAPLREVVAVPVERPAVRPIPALPPVTTTRVGGFVVAASIAPQVAALLAAASADGLTLGGGGYRDPAVQVALRLEHCGPTDYDIYEKPSRECAPPTARPGTSMHERGLAIDFTYGGSAITSADSPAFVWLSANAERFGLRNLPEEPWHWSTTGG